MTFYGNKSNSNFKALRTLFHIEGATFFKKGQLQGGLKLYHIYHIWYNFKQTASTNFSLSTGYIIYHICKSCISYVYLYIFIYTIKCRVSTELHLWFIVWISLAALSVNFLGKYLFFNWKALFIFETKLACCFN